MSFYWIAIVAALGGLLFGYDTGVISSALLFIRTEFNLSTGGQSIVAGIVQAGAVNTLLAGRLLIGIAIGVASMLTPLYLAEISPAASRGAITSLNQLCI